VPCLIFCVPLGHITYQFSGRANFPPFCGSQAFVPFDVTHTVFRLPQTFVFSPQSLHNLFFGLGYLFIPLIHLAIVLCPPQFVRPFFPAAALFFLRTDRPMTLIFLRLVEGTLWFSCDTTYLSPFHSMQCFLRFSQMKVLFFNVLCRYSSQRRLFSNAFLPCFASVAFPETAFRTDG